MDKSESDENLFYSLQSVDDLRRRWVAGLFNLHKGERYKKSKNERKETQTRGEWLRKK